LNLKKEEDANVDAAWNEFKSLVETKPEIRIRKMDYGWMKVAAALTLFVVTAVVVKLFFVKPSELAPNITVSQLVKSMPVEEPVGVSTPDMLPMTIDSQVMEAQVKQTTKRNKNATFTVSGVITMITVNAGDSAQIFMLPDNSIVYLNAKSKLEYSQNFNKTNRRVSLVGEAYFEVKKDSGQFIVECANTTIKGKATTFNVKSFAADKDVEVIVASGTVQFSGVGYKDFKKLVLTTGQSGYYIKEKSSISKSNHQRKNYKWWEKKSLRAKIKAFFDKLLGRKQ